MADTDGSWWDVSRVDTRVVRAVTVVVSALVATSVSFATTASSMDTTLLATVMPVPAVTAVAVDVPDEATSPLMSLALPRLRNIVGEVVG